MSGYIVQFSPKLKGSDYPSFTLKPYLKNVVWSKARAEREMKFALKKLTLGTERSGPKVGQVYKGRVVWD